MPLRPGAAFARRRRARQMLRRLEELDRLDARFGLGAAPQAARPRRRRRNWRFGVLMLACFGVLCALLVNAAVRSPHHQSAPAVTAGGGAFKFHYLQANGDPVGYNPCTPIKVEINPDGEPVDTEQLVRTATQHIHEASGLDFELIGTTSSRRFLRSTPTMAREPVVVGWSTAEEDPDLKGTVAGVGGSTMVDLNGSKRLVTGAVVLDADAFGDRRAAMPPEIAQAIVDHEFGHVVGLAHVTSRAELMYKESTGLMTWGPGDREGLQRLGNIRCY